MTAKPTAMTPLPDTGAVTNLAMANYNAKGGLWTYYLDSLQELLSGGDTTPNLAAMTRLPDTRAITNAMANYNVKSEFATYNLDAERRAFVCGRGSCAEC